MNKEKKVVAHCGEALVIAYMGMQICSYEDEDMSCMPML
jgi:hypothetical protein